MLELEYSNGRAALLIAVAGSALVDVFWPILFVTWDIWHDIFGACRKDQFLPRKDLALTILSLEAFVIVLSDQLLGDVSDVGTLEPDCVVARFNLFPCYLAERVWIPVILEATVCMCLMPSLR